MQRDTPTHRPKLCGNCAFLQNFHTRKLGEITVFFTVTPAVEFLFTKLFICKPGVVRGADPCREPIWVERAENSAVLKKIKSTF